MLLLAATLRRCRRHVTVTFAQLEGVPAARSGLADRFRGGFLGISRWLDIMRVGPGPALLRRETATTRPALLCCLTATGMILTGKWLAGVLVNGGRQGNFKCDEQIGKGHAHDKKAVSQGSPELELRQETHSENTPLVRG